MERKDKIEGAMDQAYKQLQKFSNLRTMVDKINCYIDVWFTLDEIDKILDLLTDYICYLVIARNEEIMKEYLDHDQMVVTEAADHLAKLGLIPINQQDEKDQREEENE